MHDDQPAFGRSQGAAQAGMREAVDVIQVVRPAGDGEPLGFGMERVHRDLDAIGGQCLEDRSEPPLFFGGGDGVAS